MAALLSACSTDEPVPAAHDPQANSEVTFAISLPQGIGDGSSASPATVRNGETLDMTISQTSSYTDPDGSVFTCEPKAAIRLHAKADTVYAKDLESLTRAETGADITESQSGTSPVRHRTVQTFRVGGQDIVFDLSHEVYTHTDSRNRQIEMPHVAPNPAKIGGSNATEESAVTRSAAVVTGVTVRPLASTRATTVTDSTLYEVNVRFSMDIESRNAKADARQTLAFSVSYVGVVETVTELQDPVGRVTHSWSVKSGTKSRKSPFVKTKGETMEVWMTQTSSYTDEYGNRATAKPKAEIKISVRQDTVWAKTLDELKAMAAKTPDTPSSPQAASQKFGSPLQDIDIAWSYETGGEANLADKAVSMPYCSLQPVTLKDVTVKELSDGETIAGKPVALYEVTATFSQKAVAENVTTEATETETEYVVSYVGAQELSIVKIEYYPGGKWVDPHDNLPLAFYPKVERYRTYSNGKRVGPDEFYDYGHLANILMGSGKDHVYRRDFDDDWIIFYPGILTTNIGDSITTYVHNFQVSQIGRVWFEKGPEGWGGDVKPGDWDAYSYVPSLPIDERITQYEDFDNPDYPADDRPSGWYWYQLIYANNGAICWGANTHEWGLGLLYFKFFHFDQFLVIDGRRIDFSKINKPEMNYSRNITDFEDDDKKGKIATLDVHVKYLGKNFYAIEKDTIYVKK